VERAVRFHEATRQIEVTPREPWRMTTYTVTVTTGARDRAGNALAAPYSFSFTAVPPPRLRERLYSEQ